jgi:hypothetical protein
MSADRQEDGSLGHSLDWVSKIGKISFLRRNWNGISEFIIFHFVLTQNETKSQGFTLNFDPLEWFSSKQPKLPAVKQWVVLNDVTNSWSLEK